MPTEPTIWLIILTAVLASLTITLLVFSILSWISSNRLNKTTTRVLNTNLINIGAALIRTVELPLTWLTSDLNSLQSELNQIPEVGVSIDHERDLMTIRYRLNIEKRLLEILEGDAREPKLVRQRIRYFLDI